MNAISFGCFNLRALAFYLFILLCLLPGCSESLVHEPQRPFLEREIQIPKAEPSPTASPETVLEHVQHRSQQALDYAGQQKGLVWPVLAVIAILWGFIQLLRVIFNLTTSAPM